MAPSAPMTLSLRLRMREEPMVSGPEHLQACQRALTQKQIQSGGGAPQVGDLRLLEDGGEREGALSPDVVSLETTDERRSGDGERVASMATGADKKAGATECADAQARRNHTG